LLAAGWKWIEPVAEHTYEMTRGHARIPARYRPLSAELHTRQTTLSDRMDEIAEETGQSEPEGGPLSEEYHAIAVELEDIKTHHRAFDTAELALAGGWLTLDETGKPAPAGVDRRRKWRGR
jgi:ParB family chromosome partitioning protein